MIDIHNHILPGIDDGAQNLTISRQMARMAQDTGIKDIIATPHVIRGIFDNSRERILQGVKDLKQNLQENNIAINLWPGAEYHLEPDLVERLHRQELMTLNDTGRYLLVELPQTMVPDYTAELFFELQIAGVRPVIAHPERNQRLMENGALLEVISSCNAVLQLTAASLTGLFGSKVQKNAWALINEPYTVVTASDAHSTHGRAPRLGEAYLEIRSRLGQETAQLLCFENPERIVRGEAVKPCPRAQPSIWQRLKQGIQA